MSLKNLPKFPPSKFAPLIFRDWEFAPHLQKIENIILDLYADDNKNNLMLLLPLGFGKTKYACQILPLALLVHNPEEQILIASYSVEFAAESVAKVRDAIQMFGKKLNNIEIDPAWHSKDYFKIKGHRGECRAVSITSKFSGADGITLIADDLYDEAGGNSPTIRKATETWFYSTFLARKRQNPYHPAKTILIGTERHPSCIQSKLIASNPDMPQKEKWIVHRLPAIDENNNLLWASKFPKEKLDDIKARFQLAGKEYLFDTLYLCCPKLAPEGGFDANWFTDIFYDSLPPISPNHLKIIAIDPNVGNASKSGDYGCILFAYYDLNTKTFYIEDTYLSQESYTILEQTAIEMYLKYRPDGMLIETNNAFRVISDNIQIQLEKHVEFPKIYTKVSTENKKKRIEVILSPLLKSGRIKMKNNLNNRVGLSQWRNFPSEEHDDHIDTAYLLTQVVAEIMNDRT